MKKTYSAPDTVVVKIQVRSHMLNLSPGGSASISSQKADGDAFAKESWWDDEY